MRGRDFPGGPVVKIFPSNAVGMSLIPGWGAKIPHAFQPKKPKHKAETIETTLIKAFKMVHIKKKS